MTIPVTERLPKKPGLYPVFCFTLDPKYPMRHCAWYEPPGTKNPSGWSLLLKFWCDAISHWSEWPPDPPRPRPSRGKQA